MTDAFCPLHPDILMAGVGCALVASMYAALNMSWLNDAEAHVDAQHWAGVPAGYGLISFLYRCLRTNTGLAYTAQGRSLWWHGFRWWLLAAFLLLALGLLAAGSDPVCK